MSVYTASIKIDATAAEAGSRLFQAAVERIRQGFDGLGGAGQQIERATQALFNFRNARDAIERAAGVSGRSDTLQRAADIDAYAREIDRLRAKYVPLAAAQQQYLSTLREIQSAQKGGALSATEAAAAIEQTKAAFANQVTAMRQAREATAAAGQSMGALRNQALTLQYTLSDIAASLGSGASPLTILMQQGPQVAQAFSKAAGGPGLLGAALAALTSPITAAVVGIGGLAVVIGSALFRASDLAKETRVFAGELQATGRQADLTTKQLHAMVEAMRDANIAKADAREAVSGILRTPGLDSGRVQQIAALTPDAAVGMGTDAATAAKALAEIASQGYPAIERFALANNALDAAQLKAIKSLAQQGDQAGAVSRAFELLGARYKDLAENSLSSMDKALLSLGRSWTKFIDAIATSKPVMNLVTNLAGAVGFMSNLVSGSTPASEKEALAKRIKDQETLVGQFADGTAPRDLTGFGAESDYYYNRRKQQAEIDLRRMQAQMRQMDPNAGLERTIDLRSSKDGNAVGMGSTYVRAAQEVELDRQKQELDRRLKVLASSPVNRAVMQARLEVEDNTTLRGDINDPASEKGRAAIMAETRARAELAAVVRDQTAAVNANVRGNMEAADAYQTSAAAGIEADARRQAGVEALTQAIDKNARAREILAEKISAELLAGSQQLEVNRNEVVNAERLAEAQKRGAGAYAETELAIKQQTATQQTAILIQVAERNGLTELADRLKAVKGEREEQIAAIEKANRATQQSIDLRKADQEVASAQAGASAAQIIDPTERRAAEIAIERQRELNRLLEGGKKTTEEIGELMQRWDLKTAADEQSRFWNDVRQTASGVSKDVSSFLTDGVTGALANGKSGFKDFWDGALQGGKRFITRLAATFLEQKIIMPIAMQVVGGMPQAFGIAAPAGAQGAAGGSGGFQIPSFGGGGFLNRITSRIDNFGYGIGIGAAANPGTLVNAAGDLVAGPAVLGSVPGNAVGATAASGGLSSYLPGIGAGIGVLTNLASGNYAGAATTAAGAAIGSIIPGVGTAIGAALGGALGSFFGGKKPTVGPGGGADFGLDASGRAKIGVTSADNGYDPMVNQSAADAVGGAAVKLFEKLGMKFQGTVVEDAGTNLGFDAGAKKPTGGDTRDGKGRYDTSDQAVAAALAFAIKNAKLDGVSEALTSKFRAIGSAADLEGLVNYVTQLRAVNDAFVGWKEPLTQAEVAMNGLKAAQEQATAAAKDLGESQDKVKESYERQRQFLIKSFNDPLIDRELRAANDNKTADELIKARADADLRKQAAALGAEAVLQVEKTLAAERDRDVRNSLEQQRAAIVQAEQARVNAAAKQTQDALDAIASALDQTLDRWRKITEEVNSFRDSLGLSAASPLSPEDQLKLARGQYDELMGKALGGDAKAAENVTQAAKVLLDKGKQFYASTQPYTNLYNEVADGAAKLASYAGGSAQTQAQAAAQAKTAALTAPVVASAPAPVKGLDGGGFGNGSLSVQDNIAEAYKSYWGVNAKASDIKAWTDLIDSGKASASGAYASIVFAPQAKSFASTGVPAFAEGGRHLGGIRLVGERGPEVEVTGPSTIYSNSDLRRALGGPSNDQNGLKQEITGLRQDIRQLIDVLIADGRINDEQQGQVIDALREIVAGNFLARAA
jgi:hypothetical protein